MPTVGFMWLLLSHARVPEPSAEHADPRSPEFQVGPRVSAMKPCSFTSLILKSLGDARRGGRPYLSACKMAPGSIASSDTSSSTFSASSASAEGSSRPSGSEKPGLSHNGIQMPGCHPGTFSARAPWCSHQGLHSAEAPDSGCHPAQAPAEASVSRTCVTHTRPLPQVHQL